MRKVDVRSVSAHQASTSFTTADVAQFLKETLGSKLVAFMTGVADQKAVGRWARGERAPRDDHEKRLRAAFQIFRLLQAEVSDHTVRAWFAGLNPQLDNESPAEAIREGRTKDALIAAEAYLAGG